MISSFSIVFWVLLRIYCQWLEELKRPVSFVHKAKLKNFSVRQVIKELCFQLISSHKFQKKQTKFFWGLIFFFLLFLDNIFFKGRQ